MKKVCLLLVSLVLLLGLVTACSDSDTPPPTPPADQKYEVTFDTAGGSSIAKLSLSQGETVVKPADPTKADREFGGWYTSSDLVNEYSFAKMPARNVTIYAKWIMEEPTTLLDYTKGWTFPANKYTIDESGTSSVITATASKGDWDGIIHEFTRNLKGYEAIVMKVKGTPNVKAIAKIEGAEALEVKFNLTETTQTIKIPLADANLSVGSSPSKLLFFLNYEDAGKVEGLVSLTVESYKIVRYIDEKATPNNALYFNSNGGTGVNTIFALAAATIARPADPTKAGYTFDNWYSDEALTTPFVFAAMPAATSTVYAKWTENPKCVITFDSKGGSAVSAITVPQKGAITLPADPTKTDSMFGGWFTDDGTFLVNIPKVAPEATALTVYAKWTAIAPATKIAAIVGWKEVDAGTYTISDGTDGSLAVATTTTKANWNHIKLENISAAHEQTEVLRITLTGTAGKRLLIKPNDNGALETWINLSATPQTVYIDLKGNKLTKILMFVSPEDSIGIVSVNFTELAGYQFVK